MSPAVQKHLHFLDIAYHICRHATQYCILSFVDEVVVGLQKRESDMLHDVGSGERPASVGTELPALVDDHSDTAVTDSGMGFLGYGAFHIGVDCGSLPSAGNPDCDLCAGDPSDDARHPAADPA